MAQGALASPLEHPLSMGKDQGLGMASDKIVTFFFGGGGIDAVGTALTRH